MKYRFRVRFNLPSFAAPEISSTVRLLDTADGVTIRLQESSTSYFGQIPGTTPVYNLKAFSIYGEPYDTEKLANEAGLRAKAAILEWAVSNRVGVDFYSGLSSAVEIEGTDAFFLYGHIRVVPTVDRSIEAFREPLLARLERNVPDKILLAMELWAAASVESSLRSQFVMRVTAIEAMMQEAKAADAIRAQIDELKAIVDEGDLDGDTKTELCQRLNGLKRESKTLTGIKLAERLLPSNSYHGKRSGELFRVLYRVRSKIVHTGRPGLLLKEFQKLNETCNEFVADLILASLSQ